MITIKKYQTIVIAALVLALTIPAMALVEVPRAEAACSYNGFINSGGKCSKSFKNDFKKGIYFDDEDYDDDDDNNKNRGFNNFGNYNSAYQYEHILQLLALIAQLQELLNEQGSFTGFPDVSEINVTTLSATNIDEDEARLRGEVDFNNSDTATVWFEYGTRMNNLNSKTPKIDLDDSDSESFSQVIDDLDDRTRYYFRAVGEDEDGEIDRGIRLSFVTHSSSGNDEDPEVTTKEAHDVKDDSAELNGSVAMNNFDNGRVFFVYGEDEDQVEDVEDDFETYSEVEENGDDLQKVLVDSDLDDNADYTYDLDGLDEDTDHYFSMCVEYEDEDGDDRLICGSVKDFTTGDSSSDDEEPTVSTDDVDTDKITDDSAELSGSVDMNDFDNGRVFFVYGISESEIEDIADDYNTYASLVESDSLSKVSVDSDLDGSDSYTEDVTDLEADTKYYTSICVQFEDSDNDDKLICGNVEEFETDA